MTDAIPDDLDVVDYTVRPLGEAADGGRIEVCPACGLVGLAVRYADNDRHHPTRYVHRRPAYSVEHPRVQQQQAWRKSRQDDADSCYLDPAPRADGLRHDQAAAVVAWVALVGHQLALLEAAVGLGWYDRIDGQGVADRLAALQPLLAGDLSAIETIVGRAAGVEGDYGR